MADELTNDEKLALLMSHNSHLPLNQRPGWTLRIVCCGDEVGTVRPREWRGVVDANLDAIRPLVSGARMIGLRDDEVVSNPSRKERHQAWLRTTPGLAWLLGSRASSRDHDDAQMPPAPAQPDRWVGEFRCRTCSRRPVRWRLEKLIAVATRRADADDPEIELDDLSLLLSEV